MLKKWLYKNYKKIILGVVLLFVVGTQTVFAADQEILGISIDKIQTGIKAILDIFFFLAGILSALAGWFMGPDWATGNIFGLSGVFKLLWIMISNVVYFIFAFLLIWIAFVNIIGKGGDNFALKTALPKFIIGIILVPFTWFIVQFFISLSSVLTVSVLSLPSDIISPNELTVINSKVQIPKEGCVIDLDSITAKSGFITCDDSKGTVNASEFLEQQPFGIVYSYLYGVFNFQDLLKLDVSSWFKGVTSVADIVFKLIFNLAFFIVFVIIIAALFIGLFIRTVHLWLYTIFSPMFSLTFFFGEGKGGELGKKFTFKEFFALIMVPVYVAGALSFGLLFISIISTDYKYHDQTVTTTKVGNVLNLNMNPISVDIIGNIFPETHDSANIFARFIMYLIGICVLRIGTMAAFKSSEVTKAALTPIIDLGQSVGSLMVQLPQNLPLIGGMSMESFKKVSEYPGAALERASASKVGKYESKIRQAMGVKESITSYQLKDIEQKLKTVNTEAELKKLMAEIQNLVERFGRNDPQVKKMEEQVAQILGNKNLNFANTYLSSIGVSKNDKLYDEEKKQITDSAIRMIIGSNDPTQVTIYRNNTSGDGTASSVNDSGEHKYVKVWNDDTNFKFVSGHKEKITNEDVNDSIVKLGKTLSDGKETGKYSIQVLKNGRFLGALFDKVDNLDNISFTNEQEVVLKAILNGDFDGDENKVIKELFGVEKLDLENHFIKIEREKQEEQEDD